MTGKVREGQGVSLITWLLQGRAWTGIPSMDPKSSPPRTPALQSHPQCTYCPGSLQLGLGTWIIKKKGPLVESVQGISTYGGGERRKPRNWSVLHLVQHPETGLCRDSRYQRNWQLGVDCSGHRGGPVAGVPLPWGIGLFQEPLLVISRFVTSSFSSLNEQWCPSIL